jgi:hypothetical protein
MPFAKGYEVMEAENGEEFLKLIRAPQIRLNATGH